MSTLTAPEARRRLYELVNDVQKSHTPIHIVGKKISAVLIAEEDWCAIQETSYLASVQGMRESIRAGMDTSVDECSEDLDW
ncbi:MAG: Antitoxin RelJ [Synergistetes bacterium ADurb.Bin520]|nr:MAG: Antitoxin RelJ [Synergistetes bacterium ADurb.Bin520]